MERKEIRMETILETVGLKKYYGKGDAMVKAKSAGISVK